MKEKLKDYFYFSKGEKNGILILLFILLILIILPYFIGFFGSSEVAINKEFEKEVKLFMQSVEETEEPEYKNKLDQYIIERYDSIKLFFFNPNTTSKENYKKLGFTDKQINTIFNYLDKGGQFYVKDDFRKIYGIRHQQYQIVKPYLLLPDNQTSDYSNLSKNETDLSEKNSGTPFVFDPNDATDEDLKKLGLTESIIKTIRNYQKKIGRFKSKDEFKKIYDLSEEKYNQLEPYIFIKQTIENPAEANKIEINTAGLDDLVKIKGIGKFTAEAIIKYRQKLGGYYSLEQLLEIKTVSPEMYELFKSGLYIDDSRIEKISLNFSEVDDFTAHPYLNYYQAKEIIKFRSLNGPYKDKKQLLQNKILLEQSYKKIEPYLSVN